MQRRSFIKTSSLCAVGIGVFGNISWNNEQFIGDNPTTTDILGPFYRPGAPLRNNINPAGFTGELFHLSGKVYKEDSQTPFRDCLVEIWQCSGDGVYDNTSDDFMYRGSQKTDAKGRYKFISTFPVAYAVDADKKVYRPSHIHMRISGNGQQDLVTQIYFKGEPYIEKDPSASSPLSVNRILPMKKNNRSETMVEFNVVMAKEFKPEASVFKKIAGLYDMSDGSMLEFYADGDSLYSKHNGQIVDALTYKGNNSFEGGMGNSKARFEPQANGEMKVTVHFFSFRNGKEIETTGIKLLKY